MGGLQTPHQGGKVWEKEPWGFDCVVAMRRLSLCFVGFVIQLNREVGFVEIVSEFSEFEHLPKLLMALTGVGRVKITVATCYINFGILIKIPQNLELDLP